MRRWRRERRELCKHENPKTGRKCRLHKGHFSSHKWWTSVWNSSQLSQTWPRDEGNQADEAYERQVSDG